MAIKGIIATLTAETARQTTVVQSVQVLVAGLIDRLQNAVDIGDIAAVEAAIAEVKANSDALTAAVVANTPAAVDPVV